MLRPAAARYTMSAINSFVPGGAMGFRKSVAGGCFMVASLAVAGAGYVVVAQSGAASAGTASKEWPTYGHNSNATRFSPLRQITPQNVSQLQVAWVYHMRPAVPGTPAAA